MGFGLLVLQRKSLAVVRACESSKGEHFTSFAGNLTQVLSAKFQSFNHCTNITLW